MKNKILHDDIHYWQNRDSEQYRVLRDAHEQNAMAGVASIRLIYEAIQLARFSDASAWVWQSEQAEKHPALLTLCAAWRGYRGEEECAHEARIPYIQVFLGKEMYVPLIPNIASMPVQIDNDALKKAVRESSILFGEHFLVTFLASRRISASKSREPNIIHHTVQDQPFLRENLLFSDQRMTISCQMLQGLYTFPKRFPSLWQYLKKSQEVTHYEIH